MNELAKIPEELKEVIKGSGIELTKAETIASGYAPFFEQVTEQGKILKSLKKGNIEDVEKAKRIRIDLGHIASRAGDQKKLDKDVLLIETRLIDAFYNAINNAARLTQGEASDIEKHFDKIEAERIEKLASERKSELEKYTEIIPMDLGKMDDSVWAGFLANTIAGYKALKEAEARAEEERIENKRIEKLHNSRKEGVIQDWRFVPEENKADNFGEYSDEQWNRLIATMEGNSQKFEAEQERIKAENERLQKEAEANEKERIDREEKDRIEREKQEEILRKEREEKADIARKLQEAKDQKEREDKEMVENELKEAEAKEKAIQAELNKGDEDKFKDLLNDCEVLKTKYQFKSKANQKKLADFVNLMDKVINHLKS